MTFKYAVPLVLSLGLYGCAGAHLYDSDKDALAQNAKSTFAKADLDGVIATHRANLATLFDRDMASATRRAAIDRDGALLPIVDRPSRHALSKDISAEIDRLTLNGSGRIDSVMFLGARLDMEDAAARLDHAAKDFAIAWREDAPPCGEKALPPWPDMPADLARIHEKTEEGWRKGVQESDYGEIFEECKRMAAAETAERQAVSAGPASKVGKLYATLEAARQTQLENATAAALAKAELAKTAAKLKAAVPAEPEKFAPWLDNAESQLRSGIQALENTAQAFGYGKSAAAAVKLDAIEAFLDKLADPAAAPKATGTSVDASKDSDLLIAAALLKSLPTLADGIVAARAAVSAPPLSALLIERARQQALLDQARRMITRQNARVAALDVQYRALGSELLYLQHARCALEKCDASSGSSRAPNCPNGVSLFTCDRQFATAATLYGSGVYVGQRGSYIGNAITSNVDYEMAADQTEYALQAYKAIIETPLDQIAAYHAAGIKPEDLAKLFVDAAGFSVIGGKL